MLGQTVLRDYYIIEVGGFFSATIITTGGTTGGSVTNSSSNAMFLVGWPFKRVKQWVKIKGGTLTEIFDVADISAHGEIECGS